MRAKEYLRKNQFWQTSFTDDQVAELMETYASQKVLEHKCEHCGKKSVS